MANQLQSKFLHLFTLQRLFHFDDSIQRTWLSAESVSDNIRLARMVVDIHIIILDQLHPSTLPHIQLLLSKNVLEALMIGIQLTHVAYQIVVPCLEGMYHSGKLEVMGRVILLMGTKLP